MAQRKLTSWLYEPFTLATEPQFHRRLLIISGSMHSCNKRIINLLSQAPSHVVIQHSGNNPAFSTSSATRKHLLGNECDIALLHAHDTFSPGDLMALAGTVRRAGCLIISCPSFETWPSSINTAFVSHGFSMPSSHYIARFIELIFNNDKVARWSEDTLYLPPLASFSTINNVLANTQSPYNTNVFKSPCQQRGFDTLTTIWRTNTPKAVITAPRGRGKSALLGLLIGSRINADKRIVITSTVRENTKNIFKHLSIYVPELIKISSTQYTHPQNGATIEWFAPDNPALINTPADILIIDEAASFPIPMLKRLLGSANAWIISTTLQGYEGSGQGFVHKMRDEFDNMGATNIRLSTPIRWLENDALERFINALCLFELNNTPNPLTKGEITEPTIDTNQLSYKRCSMCSLDNVQLSCVMGLLALAHYQTTPDDFMRLLDSPDLELVVQIYQQKIIGVCVVAIEGGEKLQPLANDIAQGHRRPKGHLGAQRIALLASEPSAATFHYWRINRIAINPHYQNKALGSQLLAYVYHCALGNNIDGITVSYGQTHSLNHFWTKNGYTIIDNGIKPNKASGETSALAINPINKPLQQLSELLLRIYELEKTNKVLPLNHVPDDIKRVYLKKINQFINGTRTLSQTQWPIGCMACELEQSSYLQTYDEHNKLIKILKNIPLDTNKLLNLLNATGKKHLTKLLKTHIARMLNAYLAN